MVLRIKSGNSVTGLEVSTCTSTPHRKDEEIRSNRPVFGFPVLSTGEGELVGSEPCESLERFLLEVHTILGLAFNSVTVAHPPGIR